jgi:hypothetical protein
MAVENGSEVMPYYIQTLCETGVQAGMGYLLLTPQVTRDTLSVEAQTFETSNLTNRQSPGGAAVQYCTVPR